MKRVFHVDGIPPLLYPDHNILTPPPAGAPAARSWQLWIIMADTPFFSSQASQYEQHQILPDQENLDSSPLKGRSHQAPNANPSKAKALPTVTPKRFKKFFTPRSSLSTRGGRQSKAGRQLRDITKNGANRKRTVQPLQLGEPGHENDDGLSKRPSKRRKLSVDVSSSPPRSSPLKHVQAGEQENSLGLAPTSPLASNDEILSDLLEELEPFPKPIRRLRHTGRTQRVLERSFGGNDALMRGRRGTDHGVDWRSETANFVSNPEDMHRFKTKDTLPFCTASCHTNSVIAVGEEEGSIRLLDSSPSSDFTKPYVHFRPHHNAVMDITFSSDDYMIATGSGDQTSRIIDMHTQQTICILSGHKSSVKQVKFQPNDNNMLTTSARDGSVQIWDMRCGSTGSVQTLRTSFARNVDNGEHEPTVRYSKYSLDVGSTFKTARQALSSGIDGTELSVTAIQHLPGDRQHLLLTTSEANSSVKLWDLRNASRRSQVGPLSSVAAPDHHARTRNYAINAMELSSDGSRLYTVCRDNTIYAYATDSLVLGHAPEMSSSAGKARMLKEPKAGVGPLYGIKHPAFKIASFYVKSSMRTAEGDNTELLAVGSSEKTPVLFPTDERHLPRRPLQQSRRDAYDDEDDLPTLPAPTSSKGEPSIPIYEHGTALTRGHRREVTSMTWTHDGDLVSIGDDSVARCWREDAESARWLRGCGEGGGKRWNRGWADVGVEWDEEDC